MSGERELTEKELVAICNKQEEYIKELEEKLKTSSDSGKLEVARPDYYELLADNHYKATIINGLEETIKALLYSLRRINNERMLIEDDSRFNQQRYEEEYRRANKLFDELERKNNDK